MNSFILHFRPWIAALAAIIAIESMVYGVWRPDVLDRTNFLQFSFGRDETPQRLFVFDKIKAFEHDSPTIVQSGDSSGFYGIDPRVVMKHLPRGYTYLNMSCCANLGFSGYYNILDFMAKRNPSIRYMVLHITPWTMPTPSLWGADGAALWGTPDLKVFGSSVYEEFSSPLRAFHLPSMAFRRQIADRAYYIDGLFNRLDRPLLNNANYFEFLRTFRESSGWTPETDGDTPAIWVKECFIDAPTYFDVRTMSQKSYIEEVFGKFADLAKKYNAVLVIVFQPVACSLGSGEKTKDARAFVEQFKKSHPDVEVPFPLIETWPASLFSANPHIKRGYTNLIGDRLGKAMRSIIAKHDAVTAPLSSVK